MEWSSPISPLGGFGSTEQISILQPAYLDPQIGRDLTADVELADLPHQGGPPVKLEFRRSLSPCWAA